jgi:aminoglycoside/choline kinase family phosphotransferase
VLPSYIVLHVVDLPQVLKGIRPDGSKAACHRTLLHGDAKSANFMFSADCSACAAYDFQYCGEGFGVRDVAYLIASSVDEDVVEKQEQQLLQYYHQKLQECLQAQGKADAAQRYTYDVMTAHFELCLLDYVRFMAGWGFWGNARWAQRRARQVLGQLPQVVRVARTGW